MTRRRMLLLLAAVTGHLGLAVSGALGLCLWEAGPIGRVLTYYRALSGLDAGYSYFAPSVGTPPHGAVASRNISSSASTAVWLG